MAVALLHLQEGDPMMSAMRLRDPQIRVLPALALVLVAAWSCQMKDRIASVADRSPPAVAFLPQPANAQTRLEQAQTIVPKSFKTLPVIPWEPIPKAEGSTKPARPAPPLSAPMIPHAPAPPIEFDGPYKGRLTVTNLEDYGIIRYICKNPTAVACAIHTPGNCLILLGPGTWSNKDVMRHELGHCSGWPADHPGAR
jgi:hypothetical protein